MKSICFIECHRERIPLLLNRWPNVVPMAVWGCESYVDNTGQLDFLAKLPTDKRGIRFDWYADPTVPRGPAIVAAVRAERKRIGIRSKFRRGFTDQEDRTLPNLLGDMAALAEICDGWCNFNSCAGGEAWWGPYNEGPISGDSCPESYRVTDDEQYGKMALTLAACAPECVVHLPPCYKAPFTKNDKAVGATSTFAYLRQLLIDAHAAGVREWVYADYMTPTEDVGDAYYDLISETLTDCDRRA